MSLKLYDTHAHLNDDAFAEDAAAAFERAFAAGVERINIVGCDEKTSAEAVAFSRQYENVYAVVGVHPSDSEPYDNALEEKLRRWAATEKVVAVPASSANTASRSISRPQMPSVCLPRIGRHASLYF